jgi:hypothetical protein
MPAQLTSAPRTAPGQPGLCICKCPAGSEVLQRVEAALEEKWRVGDSRAGRSRCLVTGWKWIMSDCLGFSRDKSQGN